MKQIIIAAFSFIFLPSLWTQNIDETRMKRDLEVAENILSTLINQKMDRKFDYFRREIESSYLEEYGVVFRIPRNTFNFYISGLNSGNGLIIHPPEPPEAPEPPEPVIPGDDVIIDRRVERHVLRSDEDVAHFSGDNESLIEAAKAFLTDYGHLIGQLKPTDRIAVRTEHSGSGVAWAVLADGPRRIGNSDRFSVEVKKSDIDAYQKGSINRDQLNERIVLTESKFNPEEEPEIEMFSTILKRMYETDLSDTYYMTSQPYYDRMENFGVTYYLKYYSSIINDDLYTLPTVHKSKISKKERDDLVESLYPKFLEDFKKNILDYGHILKGLADNEIILFEIKLTECKECDMPGKIEVTLPVSVARNFHDGKISFDQAKKKITVTEIGD